MRFLLRTIVGLAMTSACGTSCGSGDGPQKAADTAAGADGGVSSGQGGISETPSNGFSAPHPALPQVVNLGGPVLKKPKIYPIYFSNDDPSLTAKFTDFLSKIGSSSYWKATTEEYGVGAATVSSAIKLAEAAPSTTTDPEIQAWLAAKLNANDPAFPAPDENTVFALVYPTGTTIELQGAKSCQSFASYHLSTTLDANHGSLPVAYMVIPRCANYRGYTGIDAMTVGGSHELIEAATDPYPYTNPAYYVLDPPHFHYTFVLGGSETADLCVTSSGPFFKDAELGYVVQRSWSNKQAATSYNPCVPAPVNEPYFNSAPVLSELVPLDSGGGIFPVTGVTIPVGETRTVEVVLFSEEKTSGPWEVEAYDLAALQGRPPSLSFKFDKQSGINGDRLKLDISVLKATPINAEVFVLSSTLDKRQNTWFGVVGN
jgi:hypothetical protein